MNGGWAGVKQMPRLMQDLIQEKNLIKKKKLLQQY